MSDNDAALVDTETQAAGQPAPSDAPADRALDGTTVQAPHRALGLTDGEYELIVEKMGREPNQVELAVFSLMWSEHCGYKHSRPLLKTLPVTGPRLVMGPGENAGAVDVGGGMSCAFKVESHNHPSAVEPFEGAATGVGGILRDVFAVGARPIAILDSLRFGEVEDSQRSRYLLERAVAGIGHYGNSIGVATVGGEIFFEEPYEQNCLVNAMCLGLIETDKLMSAAAAGVGNVIVLFGARTGRDGIGGASVLASAELGELDGAKRPTVQIGDPFEEKKLLECSLELLELGLLVSLQDLGAAGITSSSAEMASKGEVGIDIDVTKVPLREADMEPFEIMISESQERMLCVVEPERVDEVIAICEKWEVNANAVGVVTDSRRLRVFSGDRLMGDMPVEALVDDCPTYELEPAESTEAIYPAPKRRIEDGLDAGQTLTALLRSANLASRRWAFEQYDCLVGSATVRRPEQADAAVLLLPDGVAPTARGAVAGAGVTPEEVPAAGAGAAQAMDEATGEDAAAARVEIGAPRGARPAIAVSIDGNGRRVAVDPYRGAVEGVLECSANLACVGAEPLGLTNCLNFGNPEKPHIAWQFSQAISGLGDACRALDVPVVGGNVSLYNEGADGPIYPTPVVGMVGELLDAARAGKLGFGAEGDRVALVAADCWAPSLTGSELAKLRGESLEGELPEVDLDQVRTLHATVRDAVRGGGLSSVHDLSEGGLGVALAESCLAGLIGASIDLSPVARRAVDADALLFGEGPGAFLVSGTDEALAVFGEAATVIGTVGGEALEVSGVDGGTLWVPLVELSTAHTGGLADLLD